jgi:hypothetical protein
MKQKIMSKWIRQSGRWTDPPGEYRNVVEKEFTRELEMEIVQYPADSIRPARMVLVFHGGPTGNESYYIDSLLLCRNDSEDFCICAGTINSWPKCSVNAKEVFDFLGRNGYK